MSKLVSYDKEYDLLAVHKGFSNDEKFKGNIDVGDLVLDVSTKGRVRGIEILNATQFLKEFEIGRKVLESIEDVQFSASDKPGRIILGIIIKAENNSMPVKVAVPLEISR